MDYGVWLHIVFCFIDEETGGSDWLGDLPKVAQLVIDGAGVHSWFACLLIHAPLHQPHGALLRSGVG